MASLDKFAAGTFETAVGFGIGFALGRALTPVGVKIEQDAFAGHPDKALDAETVAEMHAEQIPGAPSLEGEAAQTGISPERVAALVELALTAPGVPELLALLRRELVSPGDWSHGLRKAKLDPRYDAGLEALRDILIDPSVIATAVQRGVMHDPGLLPVGPPTEVGRVTPMPISSLDTLKEAAGSGMSEERLAVHARIVGLPPAPGELLELLNRNVIVEADYLRGIAEGNTRNEWASFLMQLRRRLLTPHEYAELQLRGWISPAERDAGAALSGMLPDDTEHLYQMIGRPLAVHQITTGLARGGSWDGQPKDVPEPYLKALEESNIRPEWFDLAWANRYTLPSAFVLRQLLKDGAVSESEAEKYFTEEGWPPALAAQVAKAYAPGAAAVKQPHADKASTQLWGTLHRSYVNDDATEAEARAEFDAIGIPAAEQTAVLGLWNRERAIVRKTLTPSQIKKAYHATTFTREAAIARLEQLGYDAADAGTFLDE